MSIDAGDDLVKKLAQLEKDTNKIAKKMVRAGANPVADEVRKNLLSNLRDPAYVGKGNGIVKTYHYTGDLLDALGITPPGADKNGVINVKVGFEGYDRKGVPNALKARAMESGTSKLKKRPFVRPAVNAARKKSIDEMQKTFDAEVKIYAL